jgi:hypothetical protein
MLPDSVGHAHKGAQLADPAALPHNRAHWRMKMACDASRDTSST